MQSSYLSIRQNSRPLCSDKFVFFYFYTRKFISDKPEDVSYKWKHPVNLTSNSWYSSATYIWARVQWHSTLLYSIRVVYLFKSKLWSKEGGDDGGNGKVNTGNRDCVVSPCSSSGIGGGSQWVVFVESRAYNSQEGISMMKRMFTWEKCERALGQEAPEDLYW